MAIIRRETDYALRALVRLGQENGHVAVSALAREEDIPEEFLRKIMQRLNRAGIVESSQGPFGGYRLAVPAREVTLLRVLETVQGPFVLNECFATLEICARTGRCPVRQRLSELQDEFNDLMGDVRLSDILERASSVERVTR